ncbi:integrase repeat-containing protein [Candidatus Nitrosotenuis aquarius]|uniref:integrase repeat-containing protein n=1 Tax=Candidatus Nitrosotenuis aquarius TaxID=1846278 RepID=UPI000C1F843A|nr:integrase repeat-containing protein [Candidatus Nitrosotenuis aquarius]
MCAKKTYRSFDDARRFVRTLKLGSAREWIKYAQSGKKPRDIPTSPNEVYRNEWKGFEDWLGYTAKRNSAQEFLPFNEARKYVSSLNLNTEAEWRKYYNSGKKPANIPVSPNTVYRRNWQGWKHWLGVTKKGGKGKFLSFEDARKYVHTLKLSGSLSWHSFCDSGKRPAHIPRHPNKVYKDTWNGWSDWTNFYPQRNKFGKLRSYEEAKQFIHSLGLKNNIEWKEWKKSGKKPPDIPSTPELVYGSEWKGLGDWLGTNAIAPSKRKYRSFKDAREFARKLGLKNGREWKEWSKSGARPIDIPGNPNNTYRKEWRGFGDWLGTFTVAHQNRKFLPFDDARKFVRSLNLKNATEWYNYSRTKRPSNIPGNPQATYRDQWISYTDWLGKDDDGRWSVDKIKSLLKGLIESGIIYQWDEAVLYSFLNRKGLLNLGEGNRHNQFFKDMLKAIKTKAGREAIEDYVNSDYELPPDFSQIIEINSPMADTNEEISAANIEELADLIDDSDPLEYKPVESVENIFKHTSFLESINVDEEAMKFYVNYSLAQLWKNAFRNEMETVNKIKNEGTNGNKFHDEVVQTFLTDYNGMKNLQIPEEYSFPKSPLLMQLYVAYKMTRENSFGNFSGTGSGKTLSAVLSSRVLDSRLTVIVCPNNVVEHWKDQTLEIFPNSEIISGKDSFFVKYDETKYKYAILNYDKFNQPYSPNLISNLAQQKVDFVVLDEIHFSKIRDANVSARRQNLDGLMTELRKRNPNLKVLGISATPVVNNLQEGRSLLELITGKVFDDVATRPTIPNAVTLYEKLSNVSIRELPEYPIQLDTKTVDVEVPRPSNITIQQLKSNPLSIEQILTDSRIPEIVKLIEGQTIIYTEYVEKIIEKISLAVRDAGYSFARHTGSDHSGLKQFLARKVQVLIASRPISTGIDGLQEICNRLILNTLPWTNAQYQQILGRLVRRGQIKDVVHVYIIKASIAGYPYDQLKLDRIKFKKTLADCAVDGRLPEKNLISPEQATTEAVRWLERLERGEISTVRRPDLNVELSTVQVEQRIKKYGDFEKFNQRINTENSETTHARFLKNPEEWLEYHRQYREARKTWSIIPYEHWIKRLNELSPRLEIGDFGCGEAMIMESVGDRVHSFDHVAISERITSCDLQSVPLHDGSLDVIVFSLSLMSRNWQDYIKEARRCLATNGFLFISETSHAVNGRLKEIRQFLQQEGFEIYEDYENGTFTFIEARKV